MLPWDLGTRLLLCLCLISHKSCEPVEDSGAPGKDGTQVYPERVGLCPVVPRCSAVPPTQPSRRTEGTSQPGFGVSLFQSTALPPKTGQCLKGQCQPYLAHVCGADDRLTEDSLFILLLRLLGTTLHPPKSCPQITPLHTIASDVMEIIIKQWSPYP